LYCHPKKPADPDAILVRHGGLKSRLRYKTHRVVDDAHAVITAVETTTGAVDEATQLLGLIETHQDTTGQAVRTVIADARYGSVSNLMGCQKARIRAHVKLLGDAISRFQADHFDRVGFLSAEAFPFIASGRERDRLALCDTEPAGDAVG
jgi:hypothetical protein